jgi:hypothetical protein
MKTQVACYAGSSYPEAPHAFDWEGQRYTVVKILERRREPHGIGFLIHCIPGDQLFDLFYLLETDEWQIQPKGAAFVNQLSQGKGE